MKKIKYPNIEVNKEELVRYQLEHILKGYNLNITDLNVLTYVYLYQDKASEIMVSKGYSKSEKSVENLISKYRKLGLVQGTRKNTKLNEQINPIYLEDLEYTLILKLQDDKLDKKLQEKQQETNA